MRTNERIAVAIEKSASALERLVNLLSGNKISELPEAPSKKQPTKTDAEKFEEAKQFYTINEFAKKVNKSASTISNILYNRAHYNNHPLSQVAVKNEKGRYSIPASALEIFNKPKIKISPTAEIIENNGAVSSEKKPYKSQRRTMMEEGADYIAWFFRQHGKLPTAYTWKSTNVKLDSLKEGGWRSFSQFFDSIILCNRGNEVRRTIEEKLVEKGYNSKEIGQMFKISPSAISTDLREMGMLTDYTVKGYYGTIDKIKDKQIIDFKHYEKDAIRDEMLLLSAEYLRDKTINYLGLEGPNFASYISMSQVCKIDPKSSAIVEKNQRAYNAMSCIIRNHKNIKGGEIFRGLNLHKGDVSEVSDQLKGDFNMINLDYNCALGYNNLITFEKLFGNKLISNNAVMLVTLNEHPRMIVKDKSRLETDFGTSDYMQVTTSQLAKIANNNYFNVEPFFGKRYESGQTPMLAMGFKLIK